MRLKKLFSILLVIGLSKILVSCIFMRCNCNPLQLKLNFNYLNLSSIDNSDKYAHFNNTNDSIPYKAICIGVEMVDTSLIYESGYQLYTQRSNIASLGFKGAYAFQCDCIFANYSLEKKIESLEVRTLLPFSADYPAGSEMTNEFVSYYDYFDPQYRGLYSEAQNLFEYFNNYENLFEPAINFQLVLKELALADSVQFEIIFNFDDNSFICDTTTVIYPIKTEL